MLFWSVVVGFFLSWLVNGNDFFLKMLWMSQAMQFVLLYFYIYPRMDNEEAFLPGAIIDSDTPKAVRVFCDVVMAFTFLFAFVPAILGPLLYSSNEAKPLLSLIRAIVSSFERLSH